jgi:hypothetical protein
MPVAAFLFLMLRHNLRSLRLRGTIKLGDFSDLLERLARPPEAEQSRFFTTTHLTFGPDVAAELYTSLTEPERPPLEEEKLPPFTASRPLPPPESLRNTPPAAESARPPAPKPRPPEEMTLHVVVRVGSLALYGAEIAWATTPDAPALTQGEKGATLVAPVGEHELLVRYDEYQVRRNVVVWEQNQAIEIDLQKMFEFGSE